MASSDPQADQALKRTFWFGGIFIVIGILFISHGGFHLLEIYNRPKPMFYEAIGLSPEKGRMWSEFLAGLSVCLTGFLMCIKAGIDLKKNDSSTLPENKI